MRRAKPKTGVGLAVRFTRDPVSDKPPRALVLLTSDCTWKRVAAFTETITKCNWPGWHVSIHGAQDVQNLAEDVPGLGPDVLSYELGEFVHGSDDNWKVDHSLLNRVCKGLLSDPCASEFLPNSGIARKEQFFPRSRTRDKIVKTLSNVRFVLLTGIRRSGKTTLLLNLHDVPPADMDTCYVSLEACTRRNSLPMTILAHAACHESLRPSVPEWNRLVASPASSTLPYQVMEKLDRSTADTDLKKLFDNLNRKGKKTILLLDELPRYFDNLLPGLASSTEPSDDWKKEVVTILDLLWRTPDCVSFVLASSLDLLTYLDGHDIHHELLSSAVQIGLEPLENCEDLLNLALLQWRLVADDAEKKSVLDKFGGFLPSFLIYFIRDVLARELPTQGGDPRQLYKKLFEFEHGRLFADMDEYPGRYDAYVRGIDFGRRVRNLLALCATRQDEGLSKEEMIRAFREACVYAQPKDSKLENEALKIAFRVCDVDFSLRESNGRYRFQCNFIADWCRSRMSEWSK